MLEDYVKEYQSRKKYIATVVSVFHRTIIAHSYTRVQLVLR